MADTNVFQFSQPGTFADPLTEVLRNGARALLSQAVEAEVAGLIELPCRQAHRRWPPAACAPWTSAGARDRDRHRPGPGALPARARSGRPRRPTRIRFSSAILPPYARRSKSLEVLIPILYLKGVSSGDFAEALRALCLEKTPAVSSASTIARLKDVWSDEYQRWRKA